MRNIADDITIWGRTEAEHDQHLEALLERLVTKNLTLNRGKCSFDKQSLCFYGYEISKNGILVDRKKIAAISNMQAPQDVNQLRSFLGLANYCERFFKSLATITAPLRELTIKGVPWLWTQQHVAFETVKQELTKDCTMAFYNPEYKSLVTVDACPVGLGAILSQFDKDGQEQIVVYASRTLSQVERQYSQTEKEALAVVYGCETFHIYLVGAEFQLDTGHKPLSVTENGILLRGRQIVIPKSLRKRTLSIAHESHQGIVKMKMLLRTKVWWPGIDRQIESLIASCVACQTTNNQCPPEPLKMTRMPRLPWDVVHGDFCGPFPTGEHLLVLINEHSRFPEVAIVHSTKTPTTICHLQKIFSVHGYPHEFISDNGPPYNWKDFSDYSQENGIQHHKVTPLWPQANGEV